MNNELLVEDSAVECTYGNVKIRIDKYLFDLMVRRIDYAGKKFIRRKDAVAIYGLSDSLIMKYAAEAGALYKRNKMVLIKVEPLDTLIKEKLKAEVRAKAEAATQQKNCFPTCPWYHSGEDKSCLMHNFVPKSYIQ